MPGRGFSLGVRLTLLLLLLLALLSAAAILTGPASASRGKVSARFPQLAIAGQKVAVRGRVPRARGATRVVLQQKMGSRWAPRASSRTGHRHTTYALHWRAPDKRSVAVLRVAAVRSRRVVALSRPRHLSVTPTRVLAPARVTDAPPAGAVGELRYSGTVATEPGQFVALGVGPKTPGGLLARVVSKHTEGGDTVLGTEPASLIDAIPEGHVDVVGAAASSAHAAAAPRGFSSAFSCQGSVSAELTGSLGVSLTPHFALDWSWGHINSASASATVRGDAALDASMDAAGSCALPQTSVASWDAPPLRFSIGPVPVVITPKTTLYVSGNADAGAAFSTGIHGSVSATAGLRYDGQVHPTGGFDEDFSYTAPNLRAHASAGARLIPSVEFLLYGEVGPRFDLSTGLQLDADPNANPWWTLTAPVDLSAGLSVPHFSKLSVPQRSVYSRSFTLAQASSDDSPPADPAPQPTEDPTPDKQRAQISWDTDNTDVDLHVWDEAGDHAWYSQQDGIPGGQLSDDITDGYGPEIFFDDSSGRTLTYGLCYFNDHDMGPTTVDVTLTDPNGEQHQFTETLDSTGDSVLLGSSPAGSSFVPDDGWCGP